MSLTPIIWLITYVGGALMALVHPIYGVLTYFLTYYQMPQFRWWGRQLPNLRYSMIISLVWVVGFFRMRHSLPPLGVKKHPQTIWLVLLVINAFIVTYTTAVWKEQSLEQSIIFLKFLLMYLLIIASVRTKEHYVYLLYMHTYGIFSWGWSAYRDPRRSAGRLYGIGGPNAWSDNGAASVFVAILPMVGSMFITGQKWVKFLSGATVVFVLNAFILCNSRGGMVGMIMECLLALKISKGPMRGKIFIGMLVGGILFFSLMDPQFIERQQFGEEYGTDGSSTSRIDSWKGALNLSRDYPFGAGGGGFEYLSPIYISHIVKAYDGERRAVHSTYFQVLSDFGIQGFIFFMGFILSTFYELYDIQKKVPKTEEGQKIWLHSVALLVGFGGLLTAGAFTSRLVAEVLYWLPAFSAVLKNLQVLESEKSMVTLDEPKTNLNDCSQHSPY